MSKFYYRKSHDNLEDLLKQTEENASHSSKLEEDGQQVWVQDQLETWCGFIRIADAIIRYREEQTQMRNQQEEEQILNSMEFSPP